MADLLFAAIVLVFALLSWGLVMLCEGLRGERR